MILNDAIFLLDESLTCLRKIHEIEQLFADETRVAQLSEEDKKAKRSLLEESSRSVRSWVVLGNETMDLLLTFTRDAPAVFCTDVFGERIAAMLNHNILELCGPKCTELKVDKPERFYYEPQKMLQQIISIYLNLNSAGIAKFIAYEERFYTPEKFDGILKTLRKTLSAIEHEKFTNLCALAKQKYLEKAKEEDDFGDIPDEFLDPVAVTIMSDPVRTPSGYVIDRKTIQRHLLTVKNDPFTRQPLVESELIEEPELRARIQAWIKERKQGHK